MLHSAFFIFCVLLFLPARRCKKLFVYCRFVGVVQAENLRDLGKNENCKYAKERCPREGCGMFYSFYEHKHKLGQDGSVVKYKWSRFKCSVDFRSGFITLFVMNLV